MCSKAACVRPVIASAVTAQLVEAETGNHIWAERYDRDLADIFALQDEITEAVTIAVAPAIADAEQHRALRKPPGSLDAWGAYQRGLWHLSKASAEDNDLAEKFFQRAIDLDPIFAGGYKGLAGALNRAICFRPAIPRKREGRKKRRRGARSRSMVAMRKPAPAFLLRS